jgi:EAL domain-containing protein (putative c-di-GMP-specific phosphodiesterase class I)
MVEDLDSAVECLRRVAALGIKVSIDDFGTGFSSLQYLERLPVSSVKVDQMFISKIHSAQSTRTIVKSTIELAHSLGLTVVAEGIESQQIEDTLRDLGCDYGQGYHFGKPVSTDQFAELLQASSC